MATTETISSIKISPVNMESRQKLGVRAGDTVRVFQKIQEKEKTRLQIFEGLVLARKHGNEAGATFTVRKVSSGVGIEKIFPLYSPIIDKIEIIKRSKVRRAKLYHIREKVAKEIKRQMRNAVMVDLHTVSDTEEANKKQIKEQAIQENIKETKAETTTNTKADTKDKIEEKENKKEAPKEKTKENK